MKVGVRVEGTMLNHPSADSEAIETSREGWHSRNRMASQNLEVLQLRCKGNEYTYVIRRHQCYHEPEFSEFWKDRKRRRAWYLPQLAEKIQILQVGTTMSEQRYDMWPIVHRYR